MSWDLKFNKDIKSNEYGQFNSTKYGTLRREPIYYRRNIERFDDGSWTVRKETEEELNDVPVGISTDINAPLDGSNLPSKYLQGEEYIQTPERLAVDPRHLNGTMMYGEYQDTSDIIWTTDSNRRLTRQLIDLRRKRHMLGPLGYKHTINQDQSGPVSRYPGSETIPKRMYDETTVNPLTGQWNPPRSPYDRVSGQIGTGQNQWIDKYTGERNTEYNVDRRYNNSKNVPGFNATPEFEFVQSYVESPCETRRGIKHMNKEPTGELLPIGPMPKKYNGLPYHPSIINKLNSILN